MNQIDPALTPPAETLPLTLAQLDFWEEFRYHPDEAVSTVAHVIELSGAVDPRALAKAILQMSQEADVMHLRFHSQGQEIPRQSCDPTRPVTLREIDLSKDPDPAAAARKLITQDITQALDLRRDPLAVQWLLHLGQDRWQWYNRGHHIILDGYSMGLLEQRCAELYAHFAHGAPEGQPFLPFAAYIEEEEAYRHSPRHEAAHQFWADRLAETGPLPVIRKGDENYALEGYGFDFDLPNSDAAIAALTASLDLGWADLMTALASGYLLAHLPGAHHPPGPDAPPLAVWLPYMSRMGSVSVRVPALVVNILPLAVRAPADGTLGSFLRETTGALRKLRRHGRYRIEQIAEDCGIHLGERFFFSPLVNVMPFDRPQFRDCTATRHVLSNGPNDGFNITIRAEHDGSGMIFRIDADPALTPLAEFQAHCRDLPAFLARAFSLGGLDLPVTAGPHHP